ncbi:MAG: fadE16 [Amycolatopsis sp.]|uniref:acyl-CoA dehydrogenase family protein n=1 Tax=Amycolatopsis sp. TaxID=37632 RepID=UPI00260BCD76|nr:acyl-CoA dehydrogenase family protein [Amycolatopsis sp.]MCU1687671.1 fadE16 [Amycolatopsis sp.]
MPIATTEEQRALAESIATWATRGTTSDWGLAGIGVAEELGGAGGTVADAATGLEAAAMALAEGPLLSATLGCLLLARATGRARDVLASVASGAARIAVGLDGFSAVPQPDGGLVVSGRAPVLDADESAFLLLTAGEVAFLVEPRSVGLRIEAAEPFDFSRAVGTVELRDAEVPPESVLTGLDSGAVERFAVTLAVAEAAGVAAWCVRTASEYAKIREQFGRPIGSFQAVKHLCAEMLCRAEIAAALAWDAARAADETPEQHALAASAAGAAALDAAVDNAKDCIQVLGGIGFTWEHDAHRYLRRAVALRQWAGGSPRWRRQAAALSVGGQRRRIGWDSGESPAEIRAVAAEIAALPAQRQRLRLAESGFLAPHWPKPYGLDASASEQLVIDAELARAGVRRPDLVIGAWAVPTILAHGSPEQRERFAGPTLRGELVWCQLFSEPGAGSDLASLTTRAERCDGGWRLTGQKVWTSLAREADWAICLARTDRTVPKHRGITYFLVDMATAGITTKPLREITGDAVFNEVFLDDVFVPDTDVVGEPGAGWRLARTTLANERVAIGSGSAVGETVEKLLEQVKTGDPAVLERLGALIAEGSAGSLLDLRAALRRLAGQGPGPESSVRKLLGVRHRQSAAELALELCGSAALGVGPSTSAAQHEFLLTRCLSIAGGTTQVLLNLIAERLLGLPRE